MFKSPPSDLKIESDKLFGFFRAIVEDNNDTLKCGRVRVRIFGLHTEKTEKTELEGIPTEELPWAEPCMPIHEGSVSGFGTWSVPLQGSQVMVFFENGNPNRPIYFASLPGIPESKSYYSNNNRTDSKTDGFKDPDGNYPLTSRLGESDFHRLSREDTNDTLVVTKNNNKDQNISTALGGSWSEPSSPYNAKYPHNYVIATHGGIVIELDSTPGSKRINIYHPTNSFIEIDNSGNMVVKNNGEKYEIVTSGKNIHINNQRNLNVDSNSKRKIGGNEDIEIGGDKEEEITGDETKTIGGDKTDDISGDDTKTIGGSLDITIVGNATLTSSGIVYLTGTTINLTGLVNLATQGVLQKLLTEAAATLYNSHTHNGVHGVTGVPNQQMSSSELSTNTQAS